MELRLRRLEDDARRVDRGRVSRDSKYRSPSGGRTTAPSEHRKVTLNLAWLILQFAICAVLIARAGYVLSESGDRIASATGLSGGWIGLALLATVTSLPELASGISAVTVVDAPNLAVGNVLGACVFNLAFLAVVEAVQRRRPIYRHASDVHLLSAAFGIVALAAVAMSLLLGAQAPALLHVGFYSPLLMVLYLVALRSVFAHEKRRAADEPAPDLPEGFSLRREWTRFGIAAAVVLAAGSWLPNLADQLAQTMGWSRSFVGTLFMALVTTLPEMAVTLSALRLGALDMAIGNLLGSNLFNVTILAIDDLFYLRGPLLADAAAVHVGTAVTGVLMTGLVTLGLLVRPGGRVLRTASWVGVGLVATYLLNVALVFVGQG
jgi:cation:H+ antiporter